MNSFMLDEDSFVFLSDLLIWFGQLDRFFLQWERCILMGSILRCSILVTERGMTCICIVSIKDKRWGFFILIGSISLHHVIFLKALLYFILSTLEACGIAVDWWSNSSRCRQESVLLVSDVMPKYMIIALDIIITMRFAINCPTVICSATVCYVFEREASSKNYGPGVYLYHIKNPKIPC